MKKPTATEIQNLIKRMLEQCANIMNECEIYGASFYMDFDAGDCLNAIIIMNYVLSNNAIKSGFIKDCEMAANTGYELKAFLEDKYGINPSRIIEQQ